MDYFKSIIYMILASGAFLRATFLSENMIVPRNMMLRVTVAKQKATSGFKLAASTVSSSSVATESHGLLFTFATFLATLSSCCFVMVH